MDPLFSPSMQQALFKCKMLQLELKSSLSFIAINIGRGQKVKKLLSDHEAQFTSWRIYAPLVVKLLRMWDCCLTSLCVDEVGVTAAMVSLISRTLCHQIITYLWAVSKKKILHKYLPARITAGQGHYDITGIIPTCWAAHGESIWTWGECHSAHAHRVMDCLRNYPEF